MRTVDVLRELADDDRAGGVGEALELLQVLVDVVPRGGSLEGRPDEDRLLDGGRELDEIARDGKLLLRVGAPSGGRRGSRTSRSGDRAR